MKKVHQTGRITAITNARNFDGERVINDQTGRDHRARDAGPLDRSGSQGGR